MRGEESDIERAPDEDTLCGERDDAGYERGFDDREGEMRDYAWMMMMSDIRDYCYIMVIYVVMMRASEREGERRGEGWWCCLNPASDQK